MQKEKAQQAKTSAYSVQKQDHSPVRYSSPKQHVMNMLPVGGKEPFATEKTPKHSHGHIQSRKAEGNRRNCHRNCRRSFLRASKCDRAQQKTNKQASTISEKNRSWIEVVPEKTRDCPC